MVMYKNLHIPSDFGEIFVTAQKLWQQTIHSVENAALLWWSFFIALTGKT